MQVIKTLKELSQWVQTTKSEGKHIGFVPTMGALHPGHLSLLQEARQCCDTTVCSIFVNPTQFNDPKDLEHYPRPIEKDQEMLAKAGCDVLFLPSVAEMYQQDETWHIELGNIEALLEGTFRPGHFQGVAQIVSKLFNAVQPDIAFFGQKDFQQTMVIQKMIDVLKMNVQLAICPIIREEDGLAMSSRNIHLSATEREQALVLSKTLFSLKDHFKDLSLADLRTHALQQLSAAPGIALEYMELCYADTLTPAEDKSRKIVALIAVKVGSTRLIDNSFLN